MQTFYFTAEEEEKSLFGARSHQVGKDENNKGDGIFSLPDHPGVSACDSRGKGEKVTELSY